MNYPGRLGLQQRILPAYRAAFFEALAAACAQGLGIFAGSPRSGEAMGPQAVLKGVDVQMTRTRYLLRGRLTLVWQDGVLPWLERWQPSALILEANPRNLSNTRASRWMHQHGGRVIGWGLGAPRFSGPLAGWLESNRRRYLHQFDGLITYSRQGADEFCLSSFPGERIFVAPNAVISRPLDPPAVHPADFDGDPVVLFVGRLQPRKRIDLLIRACASQGDGSRPRLWVVGDGPSRPELERLAGSLSSPVQFFGDLRGEALEEKFRRADLFVLPGTGGLAVQQAMAYGLPVVVAEADGTQADLVRSENGWHVQPGDQPGLQHILEEAFQNPVRLRQMGRASYQIVAEEVNLEKMVSVFIEALLQTTRQVSPA